MPVAIRNLTSRAIYVPLNSGTNLRLSPGEVSVALHEVELKNNSKIERLRLQRDIAVEAREAAPKDAAAADAGDAGPAGAGDESDSRARTRKKT